MIQKVRGPSSYSIVFLPLSDSPPLILSLKGTLLIQPPAACMSRRFPEPVETRGTGKRGGGWERKRVKRAQRREEARIVKRQTCFCVLFLFRFSVVIFLASFVVVHLFLYVYYLLCFFHSVCLLFFIIPAFLYCVYMFVVYVSLYLLFSFCCIMCSVLCVSFCLLLCFDFCLVVFPWFVSLSC